MSRMNEGFKIEKYRTDWTGLEHEFPYERISTPFI